jgi:hypothetical protein
MKNPKLFIADAFIDGKWVKKEKLFDVFGMQNKTSGQFNL